MTPIGRLVQDVLDRQPGWTQSAIATKAGIERSVLNHYMHTPGRQMTRPTREKLAKAMRIEQWEMDEAAAEQAGYQIRRPVADLDAHKLLSRVGDLTADRAALWFRLARAVADALADDREVTGSDSSQIEVSSGSHVDIPQLPAVTTERVQVTPDIAAVLGRLGHAAQTSPELREELATFSEDLFRRYSEEQTNG